MKNPKILTVLMIMMGCMALIVIGGCASQGNQPGSQTKTTPDLSSTLVAATPENLQFIDFLFTPLDPNDSRLKNAISQDQAVLAALKFAPEGKKATSVTTQVGFSDGVMVMALSKDRLVWLVTFHGVDNVSSGPPGSTHRVSHELTVAVDAYQGNAIISMTLGIVAPQSMISTSTPSQPQHLRITNQSDIPLYNLVVVFPDERIEFGDVPGGTTTEYRDVPQGVYRYAAYDVEVNGQKYQQPTGDWIGEIPMQGDAFTYIIEVDPSRWQTDGQVIRLIKASEDPGTGTVQPTTIPPTPGNPTLQPPAGPPSLLLEMFDGHSVDPVVQQPILSLYRLDANGNLYHLYTPPARVHWGASGYDVSPDGQWLVFSEAVSSQLYKMRTDGSETVRLTDTPDSEIAPVWQADGKSILYVTYTGDRNETALAWIDASGKPLQTFPVSAPSMQNLRLSPDGQVLLFTSADLPSQVSVLFTVDLTTGKITRLGLEQGQGGIWSPDGQFAIFMGDPTQGQTMLYTRKDEKVSVLETSLELAGAVTVAWTLDGRSLVMEQGQGETREIWLWDLAAKSVKNLTPGARYPLHFLAFVGDGSRMLLSASLNGPLAQLCELDIASGSIFPIIGLPELTMGANLVAWRELPPMPASVIPSASNIRVASEALPTRIPASDSEIWVTIQGSGEEVADVRSGPATTYPVVGTIGAGKGLQAMAISADHQWIQFRYPHTVSGTAWIYVSLTDYRVKMGSLPEVETIFPTSAP